MTKDMKILGRNLGVGSGWDIADDCQVIICDLIPHVALSDGGLPRGDVVFDFIEGTVCTYHDETGDVTWKGNLLDILSKFPLVDK